MNNFFETTYLFESYSFEHVLILILFSVFSVLFIRRMRFISKEEQGRILFWFSVILSFTQLAKIPLNLLTETFDHTKDIPLHMCNFLPFVLVWVYLKKSRTLWAIIFFWIVMGVSQASFTPSVEYSLFHYDAIRYWVVHLGLVLLGLYPAINWGWELHLKDIGRTLLWLNVVAGIIYLLNLIFGSNYLYVMGKPPGTTFFSILPPWPTYILVIELIILIWGLLIYGIFGSIKKALKRKSF